MNDTSVIHIAVETMILATKLGAPILAAAELRAHHGSGRTAGPLRSQALVAPLPGPSRVAEHLPDLSGARHDRRCDPVGGGELETGVVAEAHCYKVTRTIGFVRAEAWDVDRNDLIATAQAAFALTGPRPA